MRYACFLFALLLSPVALAEDPAEAPSICEAQSIAAHFIDPRPSVIGFVKKIDGQVSVLRPNEAGEIERLKAFVAMDLYALDAIKSGANSGFEAIFTDNSIVSGEAETCLEISTYVFDMKGESHDIRLGLARGVMSIEPGQVAKIRSDAMRVRVRNDTNLAVTGTRLVVKAE